MVSNTQAPAHFYLYLNEDGSWVVAPSLSTLPGREILSQDSKVGVASHQLFNILMVTCILYDIIKCWYIIHHSTTVFSFK